MVFSGGRSNSSGGSAAVLRPRRHVVDAPMRLSLAHRLGVSGVRIHEGHACLASRPSAGSSELQLLSYSHHTCAGAGGLYRNVA